MTHMNGKKSTRQPNLIISVLPLIFMMILLLVGYGIFRIKVEVLLIICALFTGMIGRFAGFSWEQMQTGIIQCITKALPAMLIVITVGILISSWMVSGIIPMLIFYGLRLISPEYFLVSSCIVCSVVSILTGTSWGTVGKVGVATLDYLPWTFMNYLGFFFAISYGYIGFAIDPKIREDETKPGG